MALDMTPNYLGFAELEARKGGSPIMQALKTGLQTYGDVQDLIQKTRITQAQPKEIEQKLKRGEQEVKRGEQLLVKGELEAKFLPTQLQQEQTARQYEVETKRLLLKALPQDIRNKLSSQQLNNIHLGLQNKVASMSVDQLQEQVAQGELAKIYQTHLNYPEGKDDQYQLSRKKLKHYGMDLPENLDDSVIARAKSAYDTAQRMDPFNQAMAKIRLMNEGKVDVAELKKTNGAQSAFDKKAEGISAQWLEQDLPNAAATANDIKIQAQDMRNSVKENEWAYGPVVGNVTKFALPFVNQADAKSLNIALDKLAATPGASRGTKALLSTIIRAKVSVSDPVSAIYGKLDDIEAATHITQQQLSFANMMRQNGITSKAQIEESWDKFLGSQKFKDAHGKLRGELADTWDEYFTEHPEDLPQAAKQKMADDQKFGNAVQTQQLTNEVFGGAAGPSAPFNNGIISDFNPGSASPNSILTGE